MTAVPGRKRKKKKQQRKLPPSVRMMRRQKQQTLMLWQRDDSDICVAPVLANSHWPQKRLDRSIDRSASASGTLGRGLLHHQEDSFTPFFYCPIFHPKNEWINVGTGRLATTTPRLFMY
jgi:hypothetical protein